MPLLCVGIGTVSSPGRSISPKVYVSHILIIPTDIEVEPNDRKEDVTRVYDDSITGGSRSSKPSTKITQMLYINKLANQEGAQKL